jgi:hypothetical protein
MKTIPKPEIILQLGDIIDGQCSTCATELFNGDKSGMSDEQIRSTVVQESLDRVKTAIRWASWPKVVSVVGNHELYNFKRAELAQQLDIRQDCAWHSFEPHTTLRIVVLDSYCESALDEDSTKSEQAFARIAKNNPNDVRGACDWVCHDITNSEHSVNI